MLFKIDFGVRIGVAIYLTEQGQFKILMNPIHELLLLTSDNELSEHVQPDLFPHFLFSASLACHVLPGLAFKVRRTPQFLKQCNVTPSRKLDHINHINIAMHP